MSYREPLIIRDAVPSDEGPVERCVHTAYQRYLGRMAVPPAPLLHDHGDLIARGSVKVATRADVVIGVLVWWLEDDHVHIDNMAVLPAHQGQGVGTALLAEADRQATAAGRSEIRLYTNEAMTENLELYPRRGFVETDRRREHGYHRAYFSRPVRRPDGTTASRPGRLGPPPSADDQVSELNTGTKPSRLS